eukprot:TRINITY_DN1608_c0_g1_i2.p1 TRINITY_DN1608_c0_g1~~TRINITY_DN1608_c0_g1_i2.p1  ORF type:complete len:233 (-),score=49.20 TRINITY_DN1608_c0_g1_i2:170-820(-)
MTSWNYFRYTGDFLHLASIIILLWKIRRNRSCTGISLKSQELYALIFTTRYLDIFWNFTSLYNTVMKLIFLATSYAIIYLMRTKFRATYDKEHDAFRSIFLILPAFALALLFNMEFTPSEILWTFSIYLEAVAILPQLVLLQRTGDVDTLTHDYIFALGGYRFFYLLNWIYRYMTEDDYDQKIVWISGLVQTILYCDFFYYYLISKWYNRGLKLPQ